MVLIEIVEGDITDETTDAIVNAAKSSLLGGGGVDGAIHRAGGPAILAECKQLRATRYPNGLPTGRAVATGGGNLHARSVIHTVGPVYAASPDPARELESCITSSLAVADELGARSVAFPAIATGVYGYPMYEAARVSIRAAREATGRVELVRFVLFGAEAHGTFVDAHRVLEGEASLRPQSEPATRESWQSEDMPASKARVPLSRRFDAAEYARLARGLVPGQMEDKWSILLEADWLHFHRSWTGHCTYSARLEPAASGWQVAESWVSRDAEQYKGTDLDHDAAVLGYLIERLLLGRRVPFPGGRGADDPFRHHLVGYARANDEKY